MAGDVLIRFWCQIFRGQGHSKQWPENLVNTISHKPMKEFRQRLVTDVSGFVMLISFCNQRSKLQTSNFVQDHSRQWHGKPSEYYILANFTKIRSRMYLGLRHTDNVKRSKIEVMAGGQHHFSYTNEGYFTQFWSQMYLRS